MPEGQSSEEIILAAVVGKRRRISTPIYGRAVWNLQPGGHPRSFGYARRLYGLYSVNDAARNDPGDHFRRRAYLPDALEGKPIMTIYNKGILASLKLDTYP